MSQTTKQMQNRTNTKRKMKDKGAMNKTNVKQKQKRNMKNKDKTEPIIFVK